MANKIIGRIKERETLKSAFDSKKAEFVAIYGRRRIGKTYLIHHFFSVCKCTYFQTVGIQNGSMATQLANFTDDLSRAFYNDEPMQAAKSWKEAFERLHKAISTVNKTKNKKVVLFFDELPWMATPKSKFLESLEYFWNRFWCNEATLKLVVCGSSASWIIKKIINNKGGLHNRVTRQIILKPFLLYETKEYLEHLGCRHNINQILEIYMAIGGIPYYLNNIRKGLSAMQNINQLCFRADGILFNEFNNLFRSLFKESEEYIEIIRVISKTRSGISRSELEKKCHLSKKGGTFTDKLNSLEEAGFIVSFLPIQHTKRGKFYKVVDEYSLFYLHWVEPEKDTLLKIEKNSHFWKDKYKTPSWYNWAGYSFESVCYKHLNVIRSVLDIPDDSSASNWQYAPRTPEENGTQIDLVFHRKDKAYTLCEIKYTDTPFVITKAYVKSLINKEDTFIKQVKTEKQIFLTLISASGLKENVHSDGVISGLVIAEDFFKYAP